MLAGYQVVAESLKNSGFEYVFGIVGLPVIELGIAVTAYDMKYYGFRNEQGAAYSAGIVGYMTGKPGVVLAVSGPGMTNCISGMANAKVNKWPMLCISGASDAIFDGKGGFQEFDQLTMAKQVAKFAVKPASIK